MQGEFMFDEKIIEKENIEIWDKHDFIDSPFVKIPNVVKINNEVKIIVDMQYPKLGMKNAIKDCMLRKEVLEKLLLAASYLPKGYAFKIWDAYRPWSLQNELYYAYKPQIINEFHLEELSEEEQDNVIKNYVSIPKKDEIIPPLHATGGAIDLTITDLNNNKDLDFGIGFDDFSDKTNTSCFEKEGMNETIRNNRRLLYNVMTKVGFTNLPSEVWHYDFGDRSWGFYEKKPAIFKGVLEVEDIKEILNFDKFLSSISINYDIEY